MDELISTKHFYLKLPYLIWSSIFERGINYSTNYANVLYNIITLYLNIRVFCSLKLVYTLSKYVNKTVYSADCIGKLNLAFHSNKILLYEIIVWGRFAPVCDSDLDTYYACTTMLLAHTQCTNLSILKRKWNVFIRIVQNRNSGCYCFRATFVMSPQLITFHREKCSSSIISNQYFWFW